MAETYLGPEGGGEQQQNRPKTMILLLIACVLALVIAVDYVMVHRQSRSNAGQPADMVSGPQLGAEGPANNINGRAVTPKVIPRNG